MRVLCNNFCSIFVCVYACCLSICILSYVSPLNSVLTHHGHGHGIFILATHPEGIWTTNPKPSFTQHPSADPTKGTGIKGPEPPNWLRNPLSPSTPANPAPSGQLCFSFYKDFGSLYSSFWYSLFTGHRLCFLKNYSSSTTKNSKIVNCFQKERLPVYD